MLKIIGRNQGLSQPVPGTNNSYLNPAQAPQGTLTRERSVGSYVLHPNRVNQS